MLDRKPLTSLSSIVNTTLVILCLLSLNWHSSYEALLYLKLAVMVANMKKRMGFGHFRVLSLPLIICFREH